MLTKPNDPYALAKVASEDLIKMMADTFKFEYAIAVPHNIIGPRQKYDDPFRNVASIFINRMLQGKPPIIYGDGNQKRSFSFVDDCLYSLYKMIDCPSGEVYNIGPDDKDGEVVTIKKLAETIAGILDFKKPFIYMPDRPREVKNAFCSSDKIRKQFGYQTKTKLEEGLGKMIKDIKSKGAKPFAYHLPIEIEWNCPRTWKEKMI
jgi:UDP-glucose 4-epimerase